MLCDNVPDERSSVTTNDISVTFTNLQEFSIYRLTLTAVLDSFGTEVTAVAMEDFMTLTAGEYTKEYGTNQSRFYVVYRGLQVWLRETRAHGAGSGWRALGSLDPLPLSKFDFEVYMTPGPQQLLSTQ